MNIGQTAKACGVTAKVIRYYEKINLVRPRGRTASGYRVYAEADVHTLRFVREARAQGFSIEQVRDLLALWQDRQRASADVKAIATRHIQELDVRLAELRAMRDTLAHLAAHCAGDGRPECPILETLDQHRAGRRAGAIVRESKIL
ncbi:MAG: Cu(I)-responsive transcriptional regulator [Burkholderiaceae bacterium]|nr:MAG: Cu(I)-responsive transcriptional regulator [Burkholderiaceae bacterium]TBR75655.1 MAG: Cu(I)-responsive transcriptional regulator [Burkholderiaceae bacterium]